MTEVKWLKRKSLPSLRAIPHIHMVNVVVLVWDPPLYNFFASFYSYVSSRNAIDHFCVTWHLCSKMCNICSLTIKKVWCIAAGIRDRVLTPSEWRSKCITWLMMMSSIMLCCVYSLYGYRQDSSFLNLLQLTTLITDIIHINRFSRRRQLEHVVYVGGLQSYLWRRKEKPFSHVWPTKTSQWGEILCRRYSGMAELWGTL